MAKPFVFAKRVGKPNEKIHVRDKSVEFIDGVAQFEDEEIAEVLRQLPFEYAEAVDEIPEGAVIEDDASEGNPAGIDDKGDTAGEDENAEEDDASEATAPTAPAPTAPVKPAPVKRNTPKAK